MAFLPDTLSLYCSACLRVSFLLTASIRPPFVYCSFLSYAYPSILLAEVPLGPVRQLFSLFLRQFFRLRLVSKRNLTRINTVYLNGYDSSLTISVYFIETFFAKYLLQACDMPSDTRIERPTVRLLFVYTNRFSFFFRVHELHTD